MEWWHCGPLVLAVILFLLVGTVIERQIETILQRIVSRQLRPLQTTTGVDTTIDPELDSQGLEHPVATSASQKSLRSRKSKSMTQIASKPVDTSASI